MDVFDKVKSNIFQESALPILKYVTEIKNKKMELKNFDTNLDAM